MEPESRTQATSWSITCFCVLTRLWLGPRLVGGVWWIRISAMK
jgi:hypothetical protein